MSKQRITCEKCGRTLNELQFFKIKNGDRYKLCKDCLTQYIDNRKPETFLWILKEFDVPYIKDLWIKQTNAAYMKNPGKFGPKSVIGGYMRTLNMQQYDDIHHYEYSANTIDEARAKAKGEEYTPPETTLNVNKEELLRKLENGEISEAEYNTLTTASTIGKSEFVDMPEIDKDNEDNSLEEEIKIKNDYSKDESYWTNQLTNEDIDYLLLKWGKMYSPEQWITMETMYSKYAEEYDLNSDREEVLKKMCKTSLKMDEALDTENFNAYKSLATVFDQLRKSGRFTEAQKKEEKREILSTIGELAALCEKNGGIIEALPQFDPNQYPQDVIDFELKDLKSYTYHLAADELRLGDLIESYITKLEKAENDSLDVNLGLVTSQEEAEEQKKKDREFYEQKEAEAEEKSQLQFENEIEAEADALLKMIELDKEVL